MSSTTPYTCLKKSRHSSRDSPGKIGRTCTTRQAAHTTGKFGPSPLPIGAGLYAIPHFLASARTEAVYSEAPHVVHESCSWTVPLEHSYSTPLIYSAQKLAHDWHAGGREKGVQSGTYAPPQRLPTHFQTTTRSINLPPPTAHALMRKGGGGAIPHTATPRHPAIHMASSCLLGFSTHLATRRPAQWRLRYVTHSAARQDE